jgi:hypothetical protein
MRLFKPAASSLAAAALVAGSLLVAPPAAAQRAGESANGHGALPSVGDNGKVVKREFSFSAQRKADGTVTGHATLVNPAFTGANGHSPYQLEIDISCMHIVGNVAIFGGTTKRTNDPSLVDAVFFTAQDNGEPGKNDRLSRAYFWDDDPATQGPPSACMQTGPADFPLEQIENGNIQVRNGVNVP